LRAIPEIVEPEADLSMDAGNDVQHVDVEGCQYAVVQREPQAAASGRQVRVIFWLHFLYYLNINTVSWLVALAYTPLNIVYVLKNKQKH